MRLGVFRRSDVQAFVKSLEEVELIRAALGEQWQAIPVVLAGSGLRIDELAAYPKPGRHTGPLFVNAQGGRLTYRQWKPLWTRATSAAKVNATAHRCDISTPAH